MAVSRLRAVVLGLALGALAVGPARADYDVTDLGDLPNGLLSQGNGVNAVGVVVGTSAQPQGHAKAFRASGGGSPTDVGSLGGDVTRGNAINRSGAVTGASQVPGAGMHAYFAPGGGGPIDLGTLGGAYSEGFAINTAGQVAGDSLTARGVIHAFRADATGRMVDLGVLPGFFSSQARGINDAGQVAGSSSVGGVSHAMRVDGDGTPVDLGTLSGGTSSIGQAINRFGAVVGAGDSAGGFFHAALFDAAGAHDLGTLGGSTSTALGINDLGQIVGQSLIESQTYHAFLWDSLTGMRDLNALIGPSSGWVLTDATAISNTGFITGVGTFNGQTRAFLLTPDPVAVPEPPALVLLALGGLGLYGRLRRRH